MTLDMDDELPNVRMPMRTKADRVAVIEEMRAKHGPDWGLHPKEPRTMEEEQRIAAAAAKQLKREQQKILAEYQRIGAEPVYAGEFLLSPSLVKNLRP